MRPYFAYGKNLEPETMFERTSVDKVPNAAAVAAWRTTHAAENLDPVLLQPGRVHWVRGKLPGFRLSFSKRLRSGGWAATIIPDEASNVWGALYLLDETAWAHLDGAEGVPGGHYERTDVSVEIDGGAVVPATAYVATSAYFVKEMAPASSYISDILAGGRCHALPADYLAALRTRAEDLPRDPGPAKRLRKGVERMIEVVGALPLPRQKKPWGGAGVCLSLENPEPRTGVAFYPEPLYVVTRHALELSSVFGQATDTFIGWVDHLSKLAFYGRMADAAIRCLKQLPNASAQLLCAAVVHECAAIANELEAGKEGTQAVSARITGFVSAENTTSFFAERRVHIDAR